MNEKYLETIKVVDGLALHLPYHQQRLQKTLPQSTLKLSELLSPAQNKGVFRCRVVYDAQGSVDISYIPYTKRKIETLHIVHVKGDFEYSKKYANRDKIDALFAQRGQCDDVLIVRDLHVTDTSIANIAFFRNGKWYTPKEPLLQGTTRQRLIDEGFLQEADIHVEELAAFEKMALMNAMIDFDIIAEENIRDRVC